MYMFGTLQVAAQLPAVVDALRSSFLAMARTPSPDGRRSATRTRSSSDRPFRDHLLRRTRHGG